MMHNINHPDFEATKKAKRIAAIVYLFVMAIIMTGTYISQQQKQHANNPTTQPAKPTPNN